MTRKDGENPTKFLGLRPKIFATTATFFPDHEVYFSLAANYLDDSL